MRADKSALPRIERARWGLGVRIQGPYPDIEVGDDGMVNPLGGGMSVARDWRTLKPGFIPAQLGGTNNTEVMFALAEEALPADLNVRQAGPRKGHYQVEPRRRMPIQDYEDLLAATRGDWEPVRAET